MFVVKNLRFIHALLVDLYSKFQQGKLLQTLAKS